MFPCSSSTSYGDHPLSSSFDGGGGASASASFVAASPPSFPSSFPANYLLHRSISSHSLFLYTNHNHNHNHNHISHAHHPYFSSSSSSSPPPNHTLHHHHYLTAAAAAAAAPPPPPPPQQQQQLCPSSSPSSSSCDFLDFNPAPPVRRVYSTGDLQVLAAESYNVSGHEAGGGIGGRVGRYSAEERKERIEKYRSKRNQRNFHKKITYACRKTLADSRPRVRGRFARNGEPETETGVEIETEAAENGYYENFDYNVYNNYDQTQNGGGGGGGNHGSEKTLADSWQRARGQFVRNVQAEMEVETEAAENGYCENFGYNVYNNYNHYSQTQNGGGDDGSDSNKQWWPQTSALTDEEEDRRYVGDELWVEFDDVFSVNFLS